MKSISNLHLTSRILCFILAQAVNVVSAWMRRGVVPTPILVCADSNVAVDNLARGIVKSGLDVVRLGRTDVVLPHAPAMLSSPQYKRVLEYLSRYGIR